MIVHMWLCLWIVNKNWLIALALSLHRFWMKYEIFVSTSIWQVKSTMNSKKCNKDQFSNQFSLIYKSRTNTQISTGHMISMERKKYRFLVHISKEKYIWIINSSWIPSSRTLMQVLWTFTQKIFIQPILGTFLNVWVFNLAKISFCYNLVISFWDCLENS